MSLFFDDALDNVNTVGRSKKHDECCDHHINIEDGTKKFPYHCSPGTPLGAGSNTGRCTFKPGLCHIKPGELNSVDATPNMKPAGERTKYVWQQLQGHPAGSMKYRWGYGADKEECKKQEPEINSSSSSSSSSSEDSVNGGNGNSGNGSSDGSSEGSSFETGTSSSEDFMSEGGNLSSSESKGSSGSRNDDDLGEWHEGLPGDGPVFPPAPGKDPLLVALDNLKKLLSLKVDNLKNVNEEHTVEGYLEFLRKDLQSKLEKVKRIQNMGPIQRDSPQAQAEINKLNSEINGLKNQLSNALNKDESELVKELRENAFKLNQLNMKLANELRVATANPDTMTNTDEINKLRDQIATLNNEKETLQSQLGQLEQEINILGNPNISGNETEGDLAILRNKLEQANANYTKEKEQNINLKDRLERQITPKLQRLTEQVKQLENEKTQLENQLKNLTAPGVATTSSDADKIRALQERLETLQQDLNLANDKNDTEAQIKIRLEDQLARNQQNVAESKKDADLWRKEVQAIQARYDNLLQQHKILTQDRRNLENENEQMKAEMNESVNYYTEMLKVKTRLQEQQDLNKQITNDILNALRVYKPFENVKDIDEALRTIKKVLDKDQLVALSADVNALERMQLENRHVKEQLQLAEDNCEKSRREMVRTLFVMIAEIVHHNYEPYKLQVKDTPGVSEHDLDDVTRNWFTESENILADETITTIEKLRSLWNRYLVYRNEITELFANYGNEST